MTQTTNPSTSAAARRTVILLFASFLAVVDVVVKATAQRFLVEPLELGPLELRVGYNPGMAFSLGDTLPPGAVLAVTALITAALACYALWMGPGLNRWNLAGLVLVLGGAAGNLADRAADGVVTDYLHTGWFPTFNLADVLITLGGAALVLGTMREPEPKQP